MAHPSPQNNRPQKADEGERKRAPEGYEGQGETQEVSLLLAFAVGIIVGFQAGIPVGRLITTLLTTHRRESSRSASVPPSERLHVVERAVQPAPDGTRNYSDIADEEKKEIEAMDEMIARRL